MTKRLGMMAFLAASALACRKEDNDYYYTQMGYRFEVRWDLGGHHYTVYDLSYWLDCRVEEWVAAHPSRAPSELRAIARRCRFLLIDHWKYAEDASPTGYAAGSQWLMNIAACVWNSPEWNPAQGPGLLVVPHELDHVIGVHHE